MDIPEMQYTHKDKNEKNQLTPRGEIWLRGPQVFLGYYKDAEKTKQAITPDGWLKTGDVGMLMPNTMALKIIDRKKNIFKLQQGEYVASEKVEAVYSNCPFVNEVYLHGESTHIFAIAILSLKQSEFKKFTDGINQHGTLEELCENPEVRKAVTKQLISYGKKDGLHSFEQAKNVHLEPKSFVERELVTPSMKLQRFQAKQFYKKNIDEMYEKGMLA